MDKRKDINGAYTYFYDNILRCVVGKKIWKCNICRNASITDFVSVSDEAFGLLVLENGWEKWKQIHQEKIQHAEEKKKIKARYTNAEREGNSSFDGWKSVGLKRYNDLCLEVIKDRRSGEGVYFDEKYCEALVRKCQPVWKRKRRSRGPAPDVSARESVVPFDATKETEDQFLRRMEQSESVNTNLENNYEIEEAAEQETVRRLAARARAEAAVGSVPV